ncbi:MAG: glycosyltransferase family 4 protein, partial [Elusimicrobiales bacterium]|nr:glycosyltransferase family 4 protein [Elusimicrobiales bacterium]
LDAAYAERFGAALKAAPFAHWLPGVPPHHMPSAYRAADVVLNGSRAEGLANVLLEAGLAGVPSLAASLPANREVLEGDRGEPGGLLYDPTRPGGFHGQALRLVDDPALRTRLGQAARANARRWPQPAQEAAALVAVYRDLLTGETG